MFWKNLQIGFNSLRFCKTYDCKLSRNESMIHSPDLYCFYFRKCTRKNQSVYCKQLGIHLNCANLLRWNWRNMGNLSTTWKLPLIGTQTRCLTAWRNKHVFSDTERSISITLWFPVRVLPGVVLPSSSKGVEHFWLSLCTLFELRTSRHFCTATQGICCMRRCRQNQTRQKWLLAWFPIGWC